MIRAGAITLVVVAESLLAYAAAEWLTAPFDEPHAPTWFMFVLLGLLAFALPRAVEIAGLTGAWSAVVTVIAVWVAVYGVVRIEFAADLALWDVTWIPDFISDPDTTIEDGGPAIIGAVALLTTWIRATVRSQADGELETLPREMAIPLLIATVVLALAAASDRSGETGRAVMAFYATALAALAFSQLALSGATAGDLRAGGTTATLLAGTAAATVIGVLVFGLLFGLAVKGAQAFMDGPAGDAVGTAVAAVLTPPFWLVDTLFGWLVPDNDGVMFSTPEPGAGCAGDECPEDEDNETALTSVLGYLFRGGIVLFGALAVVAAFVFLLRLRRRKLNPTGAAAAQAEVSGSLFDDLRGAFGGLLGRLGGSSQRGSPAVRLYLDLLEEAEANGLVRLPGDTPTGIEADIARSVPAAPAHDITAAFEETRYGDRPAGGEEVEALRAQWRRRG